jgi:hypothetical protein
MAVRKDQVQISIAFITDESKQYAKLIEDNKKFISDLNKAKQQGKDVSKAIQDIVDAGRGVENLDLSKVAPTQLTARARQIAQAMRLIPQSAPQYNQLETELKQINDQMATLRGRTRGVNTEFRQSNGFIARLGATAAGVFGGLTLSNFFSTLRNIGRELFNTISRFGQLRAVLRTALGDDSEARQAFQEIQDFASRTPFQVDQITEAYIKLTNRGLRPSREELVSIGDLAASQGKDFLQLTEAVLDATTGEFERLKEFGIQARKENDQVTLSFKNQTVVAENNTEAIKDAILSFGELQGVQGATAAISEELSGKVSNLKDNVDSLFNALGEGGLGNAFKLALDLLNGLVGSVRDLVTVQTSATESVRDLQTEFNIEIETLQRGNLSTENRSRLIDQINTRYGEYLPNLIEETATLEELEQVQTQVNEAFNRRIILLAAEEAFVNVNKQLLEAKRQELDLSLEITKQEQELQQAREGASRDARDFSRGGAGSTGVGGSFDVNEQLQQLQNARAAFNRNQEEQQKLRDEFDKTKQAAVDLGLSIEEILNPSTRPGAGGGGGTGGGGESALDLRIKEIDKYIKAQEFQLENFRLQDQISESDYQKGLLELKRRELSKLLDVYKEFGKSQELEALNLKNRLLEVENQLNRERVETLDALQRDPDQVVRRRINEELDAVRASEEEKLNIIKEKFFEALISEQEYQEAKLEIKRNGLEQEVELLRQGNEQEILLAREKELQKQEIEDQIRQRKLENQRRTEEFEKQSIQSTQQALGDFFSAAAGFLAADEKARKRNAGAIKAFNIGNVIVAGISEVQKIWESVASLGPFGGVVGAFRTAVAAARTAAAIKRISSTKYERGGMRQFGLFGGKKHSQGGTKGYFEDGTMVEVEAGEAWAVLNANSTDMIRRMSMLNQAGGGVPYMAKGGFMKFQDGGLADINTTPQFSEADRAALTSGGVNLQPILNSFNLFNDLLSNFPRNIKAYVTYTDVEDASVEVNDIRSESSI